MRERKEDITRFAHHFMGLANERLGRQVTTFEEPAMKALLNHTWSGNLRELGNVAPEPPSPGAFASGAGQRGSCRALRPALSRSVPRARDARS